MSARMGHGADGGRGSSTGALAVVVAALVASGCGTAASALRPIEIDDEGKHYSQEGRELSKLDVLATFPDAEGARTARRVFGATAAFTVASLGALLVAQGSGNQPDAKPSDWVRGGLIGGGLAGLAASAVLLDWFNDEVHELVVNHNARLRGELTVREPQWMPYVTTAPDKAGTWTVQAGVAGRY